MCLIGPAGRVDLRPKSFEVLRYLVEHAERIVSKDELIKAVWPDVIVTEEFADTLRQRGAPRFGHRRRSVGQDRPQTGLYA